MKIESLYLKQVNELARLHRKCFHEPWSESSFEELMKENSSCGFCATIEGLVVGFVLGRVLLGEAEILTFAVDPSYQNQGVGSTLIVELKKLLTSFGVEKIFLEVSVLNEKAQYLYEKQGFFVAGHRPNYYAGVKGKKIDAIVMVCPLQIKKGDL
jgi:ribosomal-protein-alanine N-acetyltransferase